SARTGSNSGSYQFPELIIGRNQIAKRNIPPPLSASRIFPTFFFRSLPGLQLKFLDLAFGLHPATIDDPGRRDKLIWKRNSLRDILVNGANDEPACRE